MREDSPFLAENIRNAVYLAIIVICILTVGGWLVAR